MAGAGLVVGLVLPIAVATPASAATFFWAETTNEAAYAGLNYQYDQRDSEGYYHITVEDGIVNDRWHGDGWGAVLIMHRTTRAGTSEVDIGSARDNEFDTVGFEKYGHKNVWFEVCNWKPSTGERYSCARLHK